MSMCDVQLVYRNNARAKGRRAPALSVTTSEYVVHIWLCADKDQLHKPKVQSLDELPKREDDHPVGLKVGLMGL